MSGCADSWALGPGGKDRQAEGAPALSPTEGGVSENRTPTPSSRQPWERGGGWHVGGRSQGSPQSPSPTPSFPPPPLRGQEILSLLFKSHIKLRTLCSPPSSCGIRPPWGPFRWLICCFLRGSPHGRQRNRTFERSSWPRRAHAGCPAFMVGRGFLPVESTCTSCFLTESSSRLRRLILSHVTARAGYETKRSLELMETQTQLAGGINEVRLGTRRHAVG